MGAQSPLPREASLVRIISQGLIRPTRAPGPVEAVSSLLAVQGQQVGAIPHAILSRCDGAGSDVAAAFNQSALIRSWPMRGTVHVTTRADHHWLREALVHRYGAWIDSTRRAGTSDEALDRAARLALDLIASEGPVTRARLIGAWGEAGLASSSPEWIPSGGGPRPEGINRRHLIVRLHLSGVLAQGPVGANEHLIVDASALPASSTGAGGAEGVRHGQPGHRQALAEIARRYALGHGPVSAHDLARWTGLAVGAAHGALEDAVESGAVGGAPALARLGVDPRGRGRLVDRAQAVRRPDPQALYARADWADLLADHRRAASATFFLASFDELHVGYRDRSCLTDEAGELLICPARNGMFRPLLVDSGRLVGVRPVAEGLIMAAPAPSARLQRDVASAIARMEARLRR
ncbi:winged helix DNA-binding domain-containing protein [Actinomyces sp. B33]|uniref:DNA glycosylase AlkZ-like family protein n=1 Tax=Actinomyces sp. B33 TaxID=2942131 RepID=UPI002340EC4F|nr:crosslink repair DNA glycosylase YcaQ family protein [Actinomyces sp. B33]MDC4232863.1 winged helix DNA-binding domain-containing protein [Actinomyces sp. B33]